MMEALDAALVILADEGGPLHWTVVQDRALRRGLIDPFTTPDVRKAVLVALNDGVRTGVLTKDAKGVFRLVDTPDAEP